MSQAAMMCSRALGDSRYHEELRRYGFTRDDVHEYGGKTYTHDDIAIVAAQAYDRHRAEYCDAPTAHRRNGSVRPSARRQLRRAVATDTGTTFGLSVGTIVMALIVGVLGGPMGLVLAVCICLFEYFFSKDLDHDLGYDD